MFRNYFVVFFIVLVAALCSCNKKSANTETNNSVKNKNTITNEGERLAPGFTLFTPAGEKISLSDYSGKIVILDFWATWCLPCQKGIPDLVSIQKNYSNNLTVIGISLDQPSGQKKLSEFIKEYKINYPIVIGTEEVAESYGNIQAIPTIFIINKKGKIINEYIGIVPISTLQKEINSILENS